MVIRVVPNFVVLFGAVAGSVMTMKLAIQLDKIPGISRCLSWFGKNSMKILCVHLFEILILSWDFIEVKCHVPVTRLTTIILRTIFIVVVVLCINGMQGIYKKQKKQKVKKGSGFTIIVKPLPFLGAPDNKRCVLMGASLK